MKVKLKLTREQYKGVATIVRNCCNALAGVSFVEVQYRDALSGLLLKMAGKIPTLKGKGNSLTLGEVESLALWETVDNLVRKFEPYEMSLGYWMLGEMDRQCMEHVALMKNNLAGQQNSICGITLFFGRTQCRNKNIRLNMAVKRICLFKRTNMIFILKYIKIFLKLITTNP